MTATAPHCNPVGKTNVIDTWRERGRMAVPSSKGGIIDLLIVAIYETTSVNGQPLDLLIDAQKTSNDAVKQFGVVFSATPPDWSKYRTPVLWREDNASGVGRWK
jgi:hypothetical protein